MALGWYFFPHAHTIPSAGPVRLQADVGSFRLFFQRLTR